MTPVTRASQQAWLLRAERLGRWFENAMLCLLLTGLVLVASAQILLRDVFSVGLSWADGAIRLAVLWLALLGAVAAGRDRKHIAVNVADRVLPKAWRRPARALACAFTAVVAGTLTWYSWVFVRDAHEFGDTLLNGVPAWIFESILPLAFALLTYRYALNAVRAAAGE